MFQAKLELQFFFLNKWQQYLITHVQFIIRNPVSPAKLMLTKPVQKSASTLTPADVFQIATRERQCSKIYSEDTFCIKCFPEIFFSLRMRFQCALAFDHTSEFCALLVVPIWWSHFTIKCNPNDLVHKMWFKGIQRFAFKNSFSSFAVHSAASGDCKSTCQVNTSVIDDICS